MKKKPSACELDLIPEVGYICPQCKIFVKFHAKQTARIECMAGIKKLVRKPDPVRKALIY